MKPEFRLNVLAALLASASAWNEDVAQAYRLKGGSKLTPTDFDHLPPAMKEQYVEFVDKIITDEETNAKWGHLLADDAAEDHTDGDPKDEQPAVTLKAPDGGGEAGQVSTGEVGQQEGNQQQQDTQQPQDGQKQEGQVGAGEGGQPQDQQQRAQAQTGEQQDPKSEAKVKKSGKGGK